MRLALVTLSALLVLVPSAAAVPTQPATVPGEALFAVSGRGYGHGVGMSQYGALGMANAGHTHEEILANYYVGTQVGRVPGRTLRVLLAGGRAAVSITSAAPFTIADATGAVYRLPAGALVLRADLALQAEGRPVVPVPPLLVRPGTAPLALDGRLYRGRLELTPAGAFLRVVNVVSLEAYLQGVVPGEMPASWPAEALEAQAVAARSYALANLLEGKPFDLYADVRSQAYLGLGGERPQTTAAVRATAGQVVLHAGEVASTLYHASSGGRTASAADVFGVAAPYLVSRPDPWDRGSPWFRWGPVLIGARTVATKLGLDARVVDAVGVRTPSGRLRALRLETTAGATTVPSGLLRTGLGLRSTWISISVLRLDRPRGPVVFGSPLVLTGLARGVASPVLSVSEDGAGWAPLAELQRDPAGRVGLELKAGRSARYRIEASGAASPALLVRVAPRVRLHLSGQPAALSGSVRPKLAGALVVVERWDALGWTSVAEAVVAEDGSFRAELLLEPGTYRARVEPWDGFAEGVSPALAVGA